MVIQQNNVNILKIENLQKFYKSKLAVKNATFSVKSGEVIGLLGPNGAGKTTTFYMVVGLIKADAGNIYLNSENITHYSMHDRAKFGLSYLPQETSIFRGMTVEDNIYAILELFEKDKKKRKEKLDKILEEFSITHIRKSMATTLSGGERRRVEIARAIVSNPSFILLDEPFAGIDPLVVSDIMKVIKQLKNKGIGVLITDHNVRETLSIVDNAYIMYEGSIIASGNREEIFKNSEVKRVYLGEEFER